MAALDKIRSKITRAEQHIYSLQLAIDAFRSLRPYEVSHKDDHQIGKRIFYVSKAECIPDSLTAIAADVIQNLRTPLDQIAYQLVLDARNGTLLDRQVKVYFPVCWNSAKYKTYRAKNLPGVRQEVIDTIDAIEPYKGGKGHALWQLHALNTPDKHILLLGAGAYFGGLDVAGDLRSWLHQSPGFENVWVPPMLLGQPKKLVPLKLGDELYRTGLNSDVGTVSPIFEITFDEPHIIEYEPILPTLVKMTHLVRSTVEQLGRFLHS